jgi:hypothetical protein
MILSFIKSRREAIEKSAEEKLKQKIDAANDMFRSKHKEMLSKPCAIRGMINCENKCVHFEAGSVYKYEWIDGPRVGIDLPRCKLWR